MILLVLHPDRHLALLQDNWLRGTSGDSLLIGHPIVLLLSLLWLRTLLLLRWLSRLWLLLHSRWYLLDHDLLRTSCNDTCLTRHLVILRLLLNDILGLLLLLLHMRNHDGLLILSSLLRLWLSRLRLKWLPRSPLVTCTASHLG